MLMLQNESAHVEEVELCQHNDTGRRHHAEHIPRHELHKERDLSIKLGTRYHADSLNINEVLYIIARSKTRISQQAHARAILERVAFDTLLWYKLTASHVKTCPNSKESRIPSTFMSYNRSCSAVQIMSRVARRTVCGQAPEFYGLPSTLSCDTMRTPLRIGRIVRLRAGVCSCLLLCE